ncbi:MAG: AI-2E family transporter [Xanthomonadaceae bacterium]|jgi:predicted PurR-regulated permease PerM|nr:AI-2E family transporter [Xanthomonadaceae bacterium]
MMPSPGIEIALFLRHLKWLVLGLGVCLLVWLLAPILTPFVLAALLAWLGNPLVNYLQDKGRSRVTGVIMVFTLMTLLLILALLILVPMIINQVKTLGDALPGYRDWFVQTAIPWMEQKSGTELRVWLDPEHLVNWLREHLQQTGDFAAGFFSYLSRSGSAMLTWGINIVLLPILTFYFLRDWDKLIAHVAAIIPRDHYVTVSGLAQESNDVLSAFLRGQFLVMLALSTIYAIGLSVVGLKLGLLIGIIAGLISFIPYLGASTGVILALIAALVQAKGLDWQLLISGAVVFTIGQLLESYVLTPRLVGDRIGLHPVAVIFAVMAGGQLFGFLGMLLALPVAAVINVLLRFVRQRYFQSALYIGSDNAMAVPDGGAAETIVAAPPEQDVHQP